MSEERLAKATERLARADAAVAAIEAAHTPVDPGIFSGTSRKPRPKADAARFARYDREWAAYEEQTRAADEVWAAERQLAEQHRTRLERADIVGATAIRTATGWHRVVTVNAKSVTVATSYSWTDRVAFDKVLQVAA